MTDMPNKNPETKKAVLLSAGLLSIFSILCIVLIYITQQGTHERIDSNRQAKILAGLNEVFPAAAYDNNLLDASFKVTDELLGPGVQVIYPAFKNSKPAGAIISSTAPNGYNGQIKILIGVDFAGVIHAVRVVEHKETPGLGDPIDIKRSDWITQFDSRSIANPALDNWGVKKDGGTFDQLTGATITPRAVVKAVANALLYYEHNTEMIFSKISQETRAND